MSEYTPDLLEAAKEVIDRYYTDELRTRHIRKLENALIQAQRLSGNEEVTL